MSVSSAYPSELSTQRISTALVEKIRPAIRPLDCGAHYCRYCDAGTHNKWQHAPHCSYMRSERDVEDAHAALNKLNALVESPQVCAICMGSGEAGEQDADGRWVHRCRCGVCNGSGLTALLREAEPSGWQPIATAPRERTVWFWVRPRPADEAYRDTSSRPIVSTHAPRLHRGKYATWSGLETATHWREIREPAAPIDGDLAVITTTAHQEKEG